MAHYKRSVVVGASGGIGGALVEALRLSGSEMGTHINVSLVAAGS